MQQNNSQLLLTMRIMWFALLSSQLILILFSFKLIVNDVIEETPSTLILPFFGIGIMLLALSFVIPKIISRGLKVSPTETNYSVLISPLILTLALNETCSVMAFILKFIHNETKLSLVLFAVSILIFITRFPTDQKLQNSLTELKNKNIL